MSLSRFVEHGSKTLPLCGSNALTYKVAHIISDILSIWIWFSCRILHFFCSLQIYYHALDRKLKSILSIHFTDNLVSCLTIPWYFVHALVQTRWFDQIILYIF